MLHAFGSIKTKVNIKVCLPSFSPPCSSSVPFLDILFFISSSFFVMFSSLMYAHIRSCTFSFQGKCDTYTNFEYLWDIVLKDATVFVDEEEVAVDKLRIVALSK
jgi:hypothetical protein